MSEVHGERHASLAASDEGGEAERAPLHRLSQHDS